MSFPRTVAALGAIAAVSFAPSAFAFCRTITEPLPADYNPLQGCYEPPGSIPLWWRNACVGWSVQRDASKQVTLAQAESAITKAFGKWSGAACPAGDHPSIAASNNGAVDCGEVMYSEQGPNQHVIVFRDTAWPHDDPNNTLALTTVTFDKNTGELYDADMEINTAGSQVVVSPPIPADAFDFDSIVTHETGHFLGLAHSPETSAVMYAHYKPGSTDLTADDVDGICSVYAPNGDRAVVQNGGAATVHEDACNATPRHGFGTQCGPTGPATSTTSSHCTIAGGAPGSGPTGGAGTTGLALAAIAAAAAIARRRGATLRRMKLRAHARALTAASLLAAGAIGATFAAERDAHASVSIAVLFDDLVRDSSAAAVVTPMEQHSVWENGRIYTYTRVHVDRAVAGSVEGDETWVRTMGGIVGDIGQLVDGEAVLTVGRPALLFVQPLASAGRGVYLVTARAQGQFPVVLDDHKVQRFVHAGAVGALYPPPQSRVAAAAQQRAIAGLGALAPLASEVLHNRPIDEGAREIAAAWARIHAPSR